MKNSGVESNTCVAFGDGFVSNRKGGSHSGRWDRPGRDNCGEGVRGWTIDRRGGRLIARKRGPCRLARGAGVGRAASVGDCSCSCS
ncbi:hypothetical protein Rhow_003736 [Rhodococcus wratislaviensis]|uniref:Uncharacterized protein n=1 Tax=Rhodococcus wratislaviensis TaxID=44752 RepID=A0A402C919_RHOWR|nr:hypothetical protein Rhow_003736 [Rhodococcus wratislaviensis]